MNNETAARQSNNLAVGLYEPAPERTSSAPSHVEPATVSVEPIPRAVSKPEQTGADKSVAPRSFGESTRVLNAEEKSDPGSNSGLTEPASTKSLTCGETIAGRYYVKEKLGQGAQAEVYRVQDLELDEEIALKLLTWADSTDAAAAEQFKQEIRLVRRIVHPNVCRAYDLGRCGNRLFVTMELINGTTLSEMIRNDSFANLDERLSIFRDILLGLRAAHALGIVHRDVKPQNIIVTPEGRAVVMDFGLAGEEEARGQQSGTVCGTPAYIAPERIRGLPADNRSDIYSLGVVLFELTTGRMPFTGSTISEIINKHLNEVPAPIRQINGDLPESIESTVLRMLEKAPENRFASVDNVLEVLAKIRSTPEGTTVLLAVGDEDLRTLIEHHLTVRGLAVKSAGDGEEAIDLMLRERPDLIVLDVEIPKIDGFRVAEIVRNYQHLADVPIHMLSKVRDGSHLAYARQLGVANLIRRPFAVRSFAHELQQRMKAS